MTMDLIANAQAMVSQFNAADLIWIAGAVILGILAIKVILKILKVVFIIGAILMVVMFFFSSGIIPK
jgi:hypothetical protein